MSLWQQDAPWIAVPKFTPAAARLADGHYSRRKVGSPQFMPPGQTLVLMTGDEAERELLDRYDCGPDGLITYVWDSKVASVNPGYCFKVAGWKATGRSADGRKTLLQKPVTARVAA